MMSAQPTLTVNVLNRTMPKKLKKQRAKLARSRSYEHLDEKTAAAAAHRKQQQPQPPPPPPGSEVHSTLDTGNECRLKYVTFKVSFFFIKYIYTY